MGVAAHPQPRAVDAAALEHGDLVQQDLGVDDHTIADERGDVVVQDTTRHELQREGLAVDHQGVAGIVAALIPDDHLHLFGEEVGEFALSLVAPLGADDHGGGHARLPRWNYLAVRRS